MNLHRAVATSRYEPRHVLAVPDLLPARIAALLVQHPVRESAILGHFGWASTSKLGVQALQFVSFIVFARLLTPAQFGLAAIVAAFTGFAQLLTDLGLGSALIQLPVLGRRDLSAAFWINLLSGIVLTTMTWLISKPLATLFHHRQLGGLFVLGGLAFTASLGVAQLAILERAFRFRLIALIEVTAALIGYGAAIACAANGVGAASIVLAPLITVLVTTILLWLAVPFRPGAGVSAPAARRLWNRGSGVTGFNLLNYWARNADNLLLGRFATAAQLGFYSRAYSTMMAPITQVTLSVGRVLVPSLARVADQPARFAATYLRSVRIAAIVMFPLTIFVAVSASTLTEAIFGPKWLPMATILTILAASGPAQVVAATTSPVYQALGRAHLLFVRGGIIAVLAVGFIIGGLHWGAIGVAFALLLRFYLLLPYTMKLPLALANVRTRDLLAHLRGASVATALLAGATWSADHYLPFPVWGRLVSDLVVAVAVYLFVLSVVDRRFGAMLRALPTARSRRGRERLRATETPT